VSKLPLEFPWNFLHQTKAKTAVNESEILLALFYEIRLLHYFLGDGINEICYLIILSLYD